SQVLVCPAIAHCLRGCHATQPPPSGGNPDSDFLCLRSPLRSTQYSPRLYRANANRRPSSSVVGRLLGPSSSPASARVFRSHGCNGVTGSRTFLGHCV